MGSVMMDRNTLSVLDNRTGSTYSIPISHNAVNALSFKEIKSSENEDYYADQNEAGLRVFDQGFSNTAVSESKICYIDGLKGTIQYRGYSITDIIGKKDYYDTLHLLVWGKWPSQQQRWQLQDSINRVPLPDPFVFDVIRTFPRNGSPIGMIIAGLSACQSSQMDTVPAVQGRNLYLGDADAVDREVIKMVANMAIITAVVYCHCQGRKFTPPRHDLTYAENLLLMMGHVEPSTGLPSPRYVSIIERLWTMVADHEMSCSTAALLQTASALPDLVSAMTSGISAMYGPLHGGAIEVAYRTFEEIGSVAAIPAKIARVKSGKERLFGFGHRIYRVKDPRYTAIRQIMHELHDEIEHDPLLRIACEVERQASRDEYFIERNLKPNADFFAALTYKAMGFSAEFILPLQIISRTQGFVAHWKEAMGKFPASTFLRRTEPDESCSRIRKTVAATADLHWRSRQEDGVSSMTSDLYKCTKCLL